MRESRNKQAPGAGGEPFWKRLFVRGGFAWSFRMRAGDAEAFFTPQDDDGGLLAEKCRRLDDRPEICLAVTPPGAPLVAAAWELALGWGQVREPADGARDLPQLARQWEPDLLLIDREKMTLAAGCVCMPSSWSLRHAAGRAVHEVHELVPRLNPQIGDKIDGFLAQLQPGKAFRRENWGFTRSAERNYHPDLQRPPLDGSVKLDGVFLRVEHQLFTALPGGVLMGIRIRTCPLADLAADAEVWNTVAEVLRTMPDEVAGYKGLRSARPVILWEMEQFSPLTG